MEDGERWPVKVRFIHWAIAGCVVANLFWLDPRENPHKILGYVAVSCALLRIAYGFISSTAAGFGNFPRSPSQVFDFLRNELHQPVSSNLVVGHNPMAWLVYGFVWFCLLSLGISGWMMGLDAYWGEEWVENWHEASSVCIQVLVVLHFLGILKDAFKHRRHT